MQACYAINQDTKSLTTKATIIDIIKQRRRKKKTTKWQKIDDDGGDNYGARVNLELPTIRKNNELSIEIRDRLTFDRRQINKWQKNDDDDDDNYRDKVNFWTSHN